MISKCKDKLRLQLTNKISLTLRFQHRKFKNLCKKKILKLSIQKNILIEWIIPVAMYNFDSDSAYDLHTTFEENSRVHRETLLLVSRSYVHNWVQYSTAAYNIFVSISLSFASFTCKILSVCYQCEYLSYLYSQNIRFLRYKCNKYNWIHCLSFSLRSALHFIVYSSHLVGDIPFVQFDT